MPELYPDLTKAKYLALDLETKDPGLKTDRLSALKKEGYVLGFSLATMDGFRMYYPLRHPSNDNVDFKQATCWLKKQLSGNNIKVGANILYDLEWLWWDLGIKVSGKKICVQATESLLDENRQSYSLQSLALDYLKEAKDESALYEEADRLGVNHAEIKSNIWRFSAASVKAYGEKDADLPLQILKKQLSKIKEQGLERVFNLECDLIDVLLAMRLQGLRINLAYAEQLKANFAKQERDARKRLRTLVGRDIDVWSGQDLAAAAHKLGLEFPLTAKLNPSFTSSWLKEQNNEFFTTVAEIRRYNRLSEVFIKSKALEASYNGRIYPSYHATRQDEYGARTGRLSSSNPNMQQVPARDEELAPLIRAMFLPEDGEDWETFDYNQQEPRLQLHFAYLCKLPGADKARQRYIEDPLTDYHQLTANLAGIERKQAKIINLGLSYGMGKNKLAQQLGLTYKEAEAIFNRYHAAIPYARGFIELASRLAEQRGWVKTALGRRRHFNLWGPYHYEKDLTPLPRDEALATWGPQIKRWYTYKAGNAIIQGSAAELTKKAMVDVYKATGKAPVVTIHDENDYSNSDRKTTKIIHDCMVEAISLQVPLKVDYERGPSWGETKVADI